MKRSMAILLALVLAILPLGAFAAYDSFEYKVRVDVAQGTLEGLKIDSTYEFLGVPYATAGRFEEPQVPAAWDNFKTAKVYGAISPIPAQTSVGGDELVWPHRYWIQNEDCLNLNIWTQSVGDPTVKKPVLVFFHGGGQTNGSSIESQAYDGKNLSEYGDVVVVTVNHRLNVLGYLDLSQFEGYTNNLGIKDLVASLKWINTNIAQFGGDSGNVTIFGQSGGGSKVNAILHSPEAEGLVQHAIIESGGGGALTSPDAGSTKVGELTLAYLGLDASTIDQIKTVPYTDLLNASTKAAAYARQLGATATGWSIFADGEFLTADYPEWAKSVDLLTGVVFSESARANYSEDKDDVKDHGDWTDEDTVEFLQKRFGEGADVPAILAEFHKLFPNKADKDLYFYAAAARLNSNAEIKYLAGGDGGTYTYIFSYEASANGGTTSFHCSELLYAFHNVDLPLGRLATGGDEAAYAMQDVVADVWLSFATTGVPTIDGVEWKGWTPEAKDTAVIDTISYDVSYDDAKLNELMNGK
jgi:para-nitrobenzyl esterase